MELHNSPYNKLHPLSLKSIRIDDPFWSKRQEVNRNISIPMQFKKLMNDKHIRNFKVAANIDKGTHRGEFYFDSDLYKWMEATIYALKDNRKKDEEYQHLYTKLVELIKYIKKAQEPDGYLNTFYSILFLNKRFSNLHIFHELYCAGHLIEASVAYFEIFEDKSFLKVAQKFADLLVKLFLGKDYRGAPGHEEIELALIKLFRLTQRREYLELAREFLDKRGNISHFKTYCINQYLDMINTLNEASKIREKNQKNDVLEESNNEVGEFLSDLGIKDWLRLIESNLNGKVYQLEKPVRKTYEPVGHAVRAMYLYAGMADLYSETGDESLLKILELLWLKMTKAKMYITGGIGSIKAIEGFGKDFVLNNEDSYSETCAAIGNIMWNWRMLNITGKSKYADLIELLLYNAFLVGQSLNGTSYFYDNPMISFGKDKRKEWFLCPCCPTNFIRLICSLGRYLYSTSNKAIWIHQYIGSQVDFKLNKNIKVKLNQESKLPWKGEGSINIELAPPEAFSLYLRIPNWSAGSSIKLNGKSIEDKIPSNGYFRLKQKWKNGDSIDFKFEMHPQLIESDQRIKDNRGKKALKLGPLIYCIEQKDNPKFDIFKMKISKNANLKTYFVPNLRGGINVIKGKTYKGTEFKAIPYFTWANRGPTKMQIWNKYKI
ncbi:MAG: hypothetical protein BAJALOKI2v1_200045 [Promethearchaeota archaeon]|nr:MAG: hypothetical protein BAJALOKI2v1_200045 [Candidatus Lokiarchaeota archaeon]